jgi:hypothetical protein
MASQLQLACMLPWLASRRAPLRRAGHGPGHTAYCVGPFTMHQPRAASALVQSTPQAVPAATSPQPAGLVA